MPHLGFRPLPDKDMTKIECVKLLTLGLFKLQPGKGGLQVLVVDQVEERR
jgi:hypothetical protein